jgi:catecholate siderophore receptor
MRRRLACSSLLAALLVGSPGFALAEGLSAGEGAEEAGDVSPLIITGEARGYAAVDIVTATKTDTPLLDIPQSIQVVTRQQLDDQAMRSLGDVLHYVPGVTVGQGEGNRDQITLRGQSSSADFFLDGVRDDTQYYRGLYNLERVEVLKGPYALIFGRGGGGGIINRVQKTPQPGGAFVAVLGSVSSLGARDLSLDANSPLGEAAAVRLNAEIAQLGNHRDVYEGERYAINPYLAADLGGGWRAGLSHEIVHDDRVADRGIPSLNGRPLPGQRDRFIGSARDNRATLDAGLTKLRLDGDLSDSLRLTSTLLYGDYDKAYANVYASGPATARLGIVPLGSYRDATKRQNLLAQVNLQWDVTTGPLDHRLLAGLEAGDQQTDNQRHNGVLSSPTFNLAAPVYPTAAFTIPVRETRSEVKTTSAYLQDQISLGDRVDIVAGLRYDRFEIEGVDRFANPDRPFGRTDEKVSPRLGLIFKPRPELSLYASYSRSFLPRSGDQFLSLTVVQENLEPEAFTNHELGAKWDIRPGLNVTAALFQLERSNATTPDPANPGVSINVGETRTRGLELAFSGAVAPGWQISGGYAFQDAHLVGNDAVVLSQVPRHQASLWNRYEVNPRLGLGLGVIHQGSQYAAIRTTAATTRLPAFTRVDAAIYYEISDRLDLQFNIENLLDETWFPDAHNNNNISTGAPRSARVSLSTRF